MSTITERLEEIKERIEEAKRRKARAEGSIERIEKEWEKDFGIKDGDTKAVKAKIKELDDSITKDEVRLTGLMEQLEEATDWERDE